MTTPAPVGWQDTTGAIDQTVGLPLADVRRALNLTNTAQDAELLDLLEAAVELVEHEVGPMRVLTAVETVRPGGLLRRMPVIAVDAATYGGLNVLPNLVPDLDAGTVHGVPIGTTVTYRYGRAAATAAQRQVLVEMVRRAWRGTQQGYRPGYGDAPEAEGGLPPALLLTRADREALAPTRLFRGVVA